MGYALPLLVWGLAVLFLIFGAGWMVVQAVRNFRQGRKGVAFIQWAIVSAPALYVVWKVVGMGR